MKRIFIIAAIWIAVAVIFAQLPKPGVSSGGGGTTNASDLTSGTVATARLGSGTANSSTYLRGDQTWASVAAGHTTTYDTYANLPATCTTGDRYFTSDSIYEFLCSATNTWTAFYKGQKVTIPPSTGWSWVNQEGATVDQTYGFIYLLAPASGADDFRGYVRALPSTPYTVTALVLVDARGTDFSAGGMSLYESGDDDAIGFGIGRHSVWTVLSYYYTIPAASVTKGTFQAKQATEIWLRLEDNSTNRIYYWSLDGINWTQYLSETNTTNITPTAIGIFANNSNSQVVGVRLISWLAQ